MTEVSKEAREIVWRSAICGHHHDETCQSCEDVRRFNDKALASSSAVRDALEKAGRTFREYAQIHAAKLNDGLPDNEFNAITRKSERNRVMAEMCERALTGRTE